MKVLIINTRDINGGAARAAYRLHRALIQSGIESTMLVRHKQCQEKEIIAFADQYKGKAAFFDTLPLYYYKKRSDSLFSSAMLSNRCLLHYINNSDADVVHIHWIAGGFLSLEDLAEIEKPLVFSLHDMWLFTGGCHYSQECSSYLSTCNRCPALNSQKPKDLSNINFHRKKILFDNNKAIEVVGLSKWIANEAMNSSLLGEHQVHHIPNPVDTSIFKNISKNQARSELSLPINTPILVFAADGGNRDPRKGYRFLEDALPKIVSKKAFRVITIGNESARTIKTANYTIEHRTEIKEQEKLALLFSAADLVILPSIQENLSNVVLESLSCGTPVVAFDIGGNKDMITHLRNGYLAKLGDISDLSNGVNWILSHEFDPAEIRHHILLNYSYEVIASRYNSLYSSLKLKEIVVKKLSSMPTLLNFDGEDDLKWKTAELSEWLDNLRKLNQPFLIYGFGVLGQYLYSKLEAKCEAVIDKNAESIKASCSARHVISADELSKVSNTLIIVSVYDPDCSIRSFIDKKTQYTCRILSLFENY